MKKIKELKETSDYIESPAGQFADHVLEGLDSSGGKVLVHVYR